MRSGERKCRAIPLLPLWVIFTFYHFTMAENKVFDCFNNKVLALIGDWGGVVVKALRY